MLYFIYEISIYKEIFMTKLGINQRQVKTTNQDLIISEIRKAGQISRSELAKKLKLSAPSISSNIDDLIQRNIIIETGTGHSHCGRKPIILEFNNHYGYIIAVDISSSSIRVALSDLSGTEIMELREITDTLIITPDIIQKTMDCIEDLLMVKNIRREKLLCICIGSPGIIDPQTGRFIYAPRVQNYAEINLKELFAQKFHTTILLKNDVNCATKGEHLLGAGMHHQNFIHILIDVGTGAGMILNEKLFEGKRGAAGELGLWVMNVSEAVSKGKITIDNILDSHISVFALVCRINELYPDFFASLGRGDIDSHLVPMYFEMIIKAIKNNDERIVSVVQNSAIELGCAIVNVCGLLDLELVIVNGLILELGDMYLAPLKRFLESNTSGNIQIVPSVLGNKAVIYGALGEAIESVLDSISNSSEKPYAVSSM